MRRCNDHAQKHGVTRRSFRAHQVGGNDCFAMPWLQGVEPAQTDGDERSGEQEPGAQMFRLNELGKPAARSLLRLA